MKKMLFAFVLVALFTNGNSQKANQENISEEKQKEVAYGSFPSSKMDVYLPANRSAQTPFVILIHGGAWVGGDSVPGVSLSKVQTINNYRETPMYNVSPHSMSQLPASPHCKQASNKLKRQHQTIRCCATHRGFTANDKIS